MEDILGKVDAGSVIATLSAIVLTFFNGVLVLVTLYYARQTRQMVVEMREARRVGMLPNLRLDFHFRGAGFGEIAVHNVGQGPAVEVNLELTFEPLPGAQVPVEHRRWRAGLFSPGEEHHFFPPWSKEDGTQLMGMDELVSSYASVRLTGSCRAAIGEQIVVNEELLDLRSQWDLTQSSLHRLQENPPEKLAEEAEKVRKALEKQAKTLERLVNYLAESDRG